MISSMRINRSKRTFLVILTVTFWALFFGQYNMSKAQAAEAAKIKIVTSFYPVYIMAKNVVKDIPGVLLQNLTSKLSGCLHDYTLTTDDMKKLARAQVLIVNGAGAESFLNKAVEQFPNLKIIDLSGGIDLIKGKASEGDNAHLWLSISNNITQVKNLGRALEELDPIHKGLYEKNTADYIAKLETLRNKIHSELDAYIGRAIITFHEAFPYFAQEFGLTIAAVVEREPGSEPSAKELADTVELIRKSGITALFSEPQYSSNAANIIAKETGAKIYVLDPAVSGPDDYDAYINIMENNSVILKKAFANN